MKQKIWEEILKAKHIVITMHRNPDGDALGCALGLYSTLINLKKVTLFNVSTELPHEFSFLQGFNKIKNKMPINYDLLICLDSASFELVGVESSLGVKTINIDHHISNTNYADFNLVDSSRPSCAEVLFELLETNQVKLNKPTATCIYAAILSDTQFFSTDRVDESTFDTVKKLLYPKDTASFGISPYEISKKIKQSNSLASIRLRGDVFRSFSLFADGMISAVIIDNKMQKRAGASLLNTTHIADDLLSLVRVEVSIMIFVINEKDVKISLRGKGLIDLSKIALEYSGGGHRSSAGAYIKNVNAKDIEKLLVECVKGKLNE